MITITAEEKHLRMVIKDQMTDRNFPVRQEPPRCPKCHIPVDIADFSIRVDFRDVEVGGRKITLADPTCPQCFRKIPARPFINN